MPFLRPMTAASIDDILCCNPTDFVDWQLFGKVAAMPRDRIVMPDLSFASNGVNGDYCLVMVQSKATRAKLSNDELNDQAIHSKGRANMYVSCCQVMQFVLILFCWQPSPASSGPTGKGRKFKSICFVLVLICTRGWTDQTPRHWQLCMEKSEQRLSYPQTRSTRIKTKKAIPNGLSLLSGGNQRREKTATT